MNTYASVQSDSNESLQIVYINTSVNNQILNRFILIYSPMVFVLPWNTKAECPSFSHDKSEAELQKKVA